jgi:hypothetical protein
MDSHTNVENIYLIMNKSKESAIHNLLTSNYYTRCVNFILYPSLLTSIITSSLIVSNYFSTYSTSILTIINIITAIILGLFTYHDFQGKSKNFYESYKSYSKIFREISHILTSKNHLVYIEFFSDVINYKFSLTKEYELEVRKYNLNKLNIDKLYFSEQLNDLPETYDNLDDILKLDNDILLYIYYRSTNTYNKYINKNCLLNYILIEKNIPEIEIKQLETEFKNIVFDPHSESSETIVIDSYEQIVSKFMRFIHRGSQTDISYLTDNLIVNKHPIVKKPDNKTIIHSILKKEDNNI